MPKYEFKATKNLREKRF